VSRDWTPLHVEDSLDGEIVIYGDGSVRRDIDIYPTKEQYEKMQQGFMCVRCFGLTDTAFPENCGLPGCDGYKDGFPMRERQRQVMESEMTDEIRREPTHIWLPGKGQNGH
jgi:hypothetical protein